MYEVEGVGLVVVVVGVFPWKNMYLIDYIIYDRYQKIETPQNILQFKHQLWQYYLFLRNHIQHGIYHWNQRQNEV